MIVCSCVQSLIISPAVLWYYPDVDITLFAMIVIGNGTFFPIGFAIPFIIMLQEEFGFAPLGPKKQQQNRNAAVTEPPRREH